VSKSQGIKPGNKDKNTGKFNLLQHLPLIASFPPRDTEHKNAESDLKIAPVHIQYMPEMNKFTLEKRGGGGSGTEQLTYQLGT
jgi:hypothetical protein